MDQRRVLIVDDDERIRGMLATVFRGRALVVDEASDADHAVALLRDHAYAVVLVDPLMRGAGGAAVIEALSADVKTAPVVLVITSSERGLIERLDPQRIHGVIRKPFDPEEIGAVVAACTDIRARHIMETMSVAMAGASLLAFLSSTTRW